MGISNEDLHLLKLIHTVSQGNGQYCSFSELYLQVMKSDILEKVDIKKRNGSIHVLLQLIELEKQGYIISSQAHSKLKLTESGSSLFD